jgi:enterochelin esterase-like enzyme
MSAGTVKPKLAAKRVTVKKGETKKVTLKNVKGFKVTAKSKDKKTASVKKKSNAVFKIKGIKAGKTTVTFTAKKNKKKFTLKCTVVVNPAEEKAETPEATVTASQTVASTTPITNPTGNPTAQPTSAPTATPSPTPFVFTPPEKINIELVKDIPKEYDNTTTEVDTEHRGTIETISYNTETYDEDGSVPMVKEANVYLPYNYDPSKQYNVFYLMHGGGENKDTWLKGDQDSNPNGYGDYTHNRIMVDKLIMNGVIEPMIIVNPTFYRPEGAPEIENNDLPAQFAHELRKDLIPYIESHYSTYAGGDVTDANLVKTRMHRAFAGLSMGSMTTYRAALYANYDLFGWFGPYSGCGGPGGDHDKEVEQIVTAIEEGAKKGMPLGFLYCGNGEGDMAHDEHVDIMQKVLEKTEFLVDGANYAFIDLPHEGNLGEHNMWSWHVHLYNCLRLFFSR